MFNCTVKYLMPSAFGKLGESAAQYAIFMELEEMLGFIS